MVIRLLQQVTTRKQRALPQSLTRDIHTLDDADERALAAFHTIRTRTTQ